MNLEKKKIGLIISLLLIALIFAGYYRRSFYSNGENSITVWKPVFSSESYIVAGRYYNISPPKSDFLKVYASKSFYVCWNDSNSKVGINVGSYIIRKVGFEGINMYSHAAFFKKFKGQSYQDGKSVNDPDHLEKQSKYRLQYIEL